MEGWKEAEEKAGAEGEGAREQQGGQIQLQVEDRRGLGRQEGADEGERPPRDQQPGHAAEGGQRERFAEELGEED